MPDMMIELDLDAPWEPAGPVRSRRWVAVVAVLAALGGLLVDSGPRAALEPLFTARFQVLQLRAGGGRFVLSRYQGGQTFVEALDAGSGKLLWRHPQSADESVVAVTGDTVLVQADRTEDNLEYTGQITALDAATGQVRWSRAKARIDGLAPGLILAQDLTRAESDERRVALDEGSGAVAWSADTPPGVVSTLAAQLLSELDPTGLLRVRDVSTGLVSAEFRLQWSGAVAQHAAGASGQELVWPAGAPGTEVYDLTSGRQLWRWPGPGDGYPRLSTCLPGRYCIFSAEGTEVLDASTGAPSWRADGYSDLLAADPHQLIMYRHLADEYRPDDLAAFDAATGVQRWHQTGWLLAGNPDASMSYYVWRPLDGGGSVVGRLDPGTGEVRAVGRAEHFTGNPQCAATAGRVACLAEGIVYAW